MAAAFIPPLSLTRAGTNLLLQWVNDYVPALVVEESTNLLSGWSELNAQATLTGDL